MKKEHADDSWEEMAALQDRSQARGPQAPGCTRGPCEHRPPTPGAQGRGAQEPRVDPRPCRLGGHLRQGTPEIRQALPHPTAPPPRPATQWSGDTGSPDGGLSEKLSPGNFGVPGHRQALRQDAQGQDEI